MSLMQRVEQARAAAKERERELARERGETVEEPAGRADGAIATGAATPEAPTGARPIGIAPGTTKTIGISPTPEADGVAPGDAEPGGTPTGTPAGAASEGEPASPGADPPAAAKAPPSHSAKARAAVPSLPPARADLVRELTVVVQREFTKMSSGRLETDPVELRRKIEALVDRVVSEGGYAVTKPERSYLIEGLVAEITGLGPLEALLQDEEITEIMVNGPDHIYIERAGKITRVPVQFINNEHVARIIERIIAPLGRRIDESSPRVDARLPDGSRVNAVIPPLSLIGPVITIRRFSVHPFTVDDLVRFGTASPEMFDFLRVCIEARLNLFVSGGTGSGKTTTLNVLSSFIPSDERIVTIEDAAELQLRQPHIITLESRPPNLEGRGEITIRDLLRNALHMRPDRIIVGECRAGEALDMLQAMTTGQDGSLSTGHANSPRDMLRRIETMVLMTGYELPLRAIREQIASAVDLIVHTARLKDGSRKIVNITEVFGVEDDEILTQDIFEFVQTGVAEDGKIEGTLKPTGIRPTFMHKFKAHGIALPPDEFGIPSEKDAKGPVRVGKRGVSSGPEHHSADAQGASGRGRAVTAGGMLYVSGVGPIDTETGRITGAGIKEQTRQAMRNLEELLKANGSSLDKVVWANWSLRDVAEFDTFNEEWARWFDEDAPVGQGTVMTPAQRRAGFRVSLGVIAET